MSDMRIWDDDEAGFSGLNTYDAAPQRVERIRARCLATLAAQAGRRRHREGPLVGWRRWLVPAVAFGLSAVYLAAALGSALALLR